MAFKMHCDRCLKFLKVISADELRELASERKEIVCKSCEKAEETLLRAIQGVKKQIAVKTSQIEKELKSMLTEELRKIVKEAKNVE